MIKLIRYHLPPFVKHVLAPRMIFVWQITTVAGWTLTRSTKYKIKTFTKEPPSDWFQDELCLDGGDDWSRGRPARVGGDGQGGPHQPLHQVRKSQTSLILPFQCAQVQVRVPQGCGAKEQMAGSTSWGYYRHNFFSSKSLYSFLIKIFAFRRHVFCCFQVRSARGCGSVFEVIHVVRPYYSHSIVTTAGPFKVVEINFISQ